jgi:hypothetical protein
MKIGFDILHQIPRDIVAKRVVFDEGDHYDPKVKSNTYLYSTEPLPIKKLTDLPSHVRFDPNFKDYTGFKFGYFTVVGLFALDKFDKWVLRCACGCYEIRRTSVLKKNPQAVDQNRCQSCIDLERLRNKDFFNSNGYYPWQKPKTEKQKELYKKHKK